MSRPVFLIKEVTIRKAGNMYPRFMVSGWINDRRVRQVCTEILDYLEGFYNRTRLHSALGCQSPLDYESSLS